MSTYSEPADELSDSGAPTLPPNSYMAPFVRMSYAVLQLSMLTLGIQICLCLYSLSVYRKSPPQMRRQRKPFLVVSFAILFLFTLSHTMDSLVFADWVINSGVSFAEYIASDVQSPHWGELAGTIANILVTGVADALLIYRCFAIWRNHRLRLVHVGLPVLAFLGSIGFGIGEIVTGRSPHTIDLTLHLSSAYQGLSVLVTILVTSSISYRLIKEQKRLAGVLGREITAKYTSASAILIESALPFTLFGIGTVVLSSISTRLGQSAPMALALSSSVVDSLWYCSSALCPQIIIFRVTTGQSYANDWNASMNQELSQLRFSPTEPKEDHTRNPATESTASSEI